MANLPADKRNDHDRGCQGREYTCTCGYDGERDDEIERLRGAIRLYVHSKKSGIGRNALDWWRLQEIEKESAVDVSVTTGDKTNAEGN